MVTGSTGRGLSGGSGIWRRKPVTVEEREGGLQRSMGLVQLTAIDVVSRVSDKLTIDLLTRDFGEIPAPTDN